MLIPRFIIRTLPPSYNAETLTLLTKRIGNVPLPTARRVLVKFVMALRLATVSIPIPKAIVSLINLVGDTCLLDVAARSRRLTPTTTSDPYSVHQPIGM